ncbi:MAG: enoyl-CoA hydratase-related protein [Gammaproteobacteria bacterium]|nr:enoyl-CoA hydratase-related protein [Gammaproteobacteria bacterium]
MTKQYKTLTLEIQPEKILIVTLNRPNSRNAINSQMMIELQQLWQELAVNDKKIRCVVLTGTGTAFCAGADLKERKNITLDLWRIQHVPLEEAMVAMVECPIPIISAVNGAAFGGGLELILASDFAYAVNTAQFAQSEVKLGLMPGAMGTQNLPKACGIKRAKELTFSGEIFTATEAYDWGIINKICDPESLMNDVLATAKKIAMNAPLAVIAAKKALNLSHSIDVISGFHSEIEIYNELLETADRAEGIAAFNEKRVPKFIGK